MAGNFVMTVPLLLPKICRACSAWMSFLNMIIVILGSAMVSLMVLSVLLHCRQKNSTLL